jgi:hypothetical protein
MVEDHQIVAIKGIHPENIGVQNHAADLVEWQVDSVSATIE